MCCSFDDFKVNKGNCIVGGTDSDPKPEPAPEPASEPEPESAPEPAPAPAPVDDFEEENDNDLVQTSTGESVNNETGLVANGSLSTGTCAKKYKACSADKACCDSSNHCVKKHSKFAGCRPKDGVLPSDWDGEIIA